MPFILEIVRATEKRFHYPRPRKLNNLENISIDCPRSILIEFQKTLENSPILGSTFFNPYIQENETFPQKADELTPRHLQLLARNEFFNTNGVMATSLYGGLLSDDQIARIRCLVKGMTVSGGVPVFAYGGFKSKNFPLNTDVIENAILVDQSGLQWQGDFRNTGGMFFYPDDPNHSKLPLAYQAWQEDMYQALVREPRPKRVSSNKLEVVWNQVKGSVDLDQVQKMITLEFLQALKSATHQSDRELGPNDQVNFKFLNAGMGFFANGIVKSSTPQSDQLSHARLKGIEQALNTLRLLPPEKRYLGKIKRLEFPFSHQKGAKTTIKNIEALTRALGLEWGGMLEEDALMPRPGFVNATTNCADPHAMIGNEGGHQSVDASIATNADVNNLNMGFHKSSVKNTYRSSGLKEANHSFLKKLAIGLLVSILVGGLGFVFLGPLGLIAGGVSALGFALAEVYQRHSRKETHISQKEAVKTPLLVSPDGVVNASKTSQPEVLVKITSSSEIITPNKSSTRKLKK